MLAESLFLRFLLLSLTGGTAALLLRLARPLLRKGPARWAVLLWILLALRMLVPWGFALRAPLPEAPAPDQSGAMAALADPTFAASVIPPAEIMHNPEITPLAIAGAIWLAGALAFAAVHMIGYQREKRRMLRGTRSAPPTALRLLRALCAELRLRRAPSLLLSNGVQAPITMGLLRPAILLPAKVYSYEELEFVLRHELCHLRHGDLRLKCLLLAVNALHWFNPALWLLRREAGAAMELACDERVVGGAEDRRGAYSQALLSAAGRPARAWMLTTGLNGGKCDMKEMKYRLRNILNAGKKCGPAAAVAVLLCASLAVTAAGIGPGFVMRRKAHRHHPTQSNAVAVTRPTEPKTEPATEPEPTTKPVTTTRPATQTSEPETEPRTTTKPRVSSAGMVWPVPACGRIARAYGYQGRSFHKGIDIADGNTNGKIVVAAKDGVVELVQFGGSSYGNQIIINHGNGVKTRYAHLMSGSVTVTEGEQVSAGQPIARVGSTGNSTGPHLHFEVLVNGVTQNPQGYV